MPFEPWKLACLLACVLLYAAGETVEAGDGEGGPDDALVWGEEIATVFFSTLFELCSLCSRATHVSRRVLHPCVFFEVLTLARRPVLWAGTLLRLAAYGSAARLEDAPARGSPVNP